MENVCKVVQISGITAIATQRKTIVPGASFANVETATVISETNRLRQSNGC